MALPALWLWNAAEDRQAAAHCVDCCVTVHYALAEYGIELEMQAVGVGIAAPGTEPQLYGGDGRRPHCNEDGTFNGHTILVIPAAGRLLDPTFQQFAEIPSYGDPAADNGRATCPGRASAQHRSASTAPITSCSTSHWLPPTATPG